MISSKKVHKAYYGNRANPVNEIRGKGRPFLSKVRSEFLISHITVVFVTLVMFASTLSGCQNTDNQEDTTNIVMNMSWAKSYRNIYELEKESDFIGLVEITGEVRYGEIPTDGAAFSIPFTVYSAKVIDSIGTDKKSIDIFMTGRAGSFVIADDPLMQKGDIWFIFAKLNDDETYTILGGPQGRFTYDKTEDTISSLYYSKYTNTSSEHEEKFGISMMDLNLSEVNTEIKTLRDNKNIK